MDIKHGVPILLVIVGGLLTAAGAYLWHSGPLTIDSRIYLGAGLALVISTIIVWIRTGLEASGRKRFPHDDEFSRALKHRAGHAAFHMSIFSWMAVFLFQDVFVDSQSMLGTGILGMVVLYGISFLVVRHRAMNDEDAN